LKYAQAKSKFISTWKGVCCGFFGAGQFDAYVSNYSRERRGAYVSISKNRRDANFYNYQIDFFRYMFYNALRGGV
ncbi:MAG TPA: hypothetical protein PKK13_01580, partial [Spirochaetota bacterium]|nr:hypothetical protein [Spirochaetota bacterium]HQB62033.1 hypothetical protein [Spirochaetota bacterium]